MTHFKDYTWLHILELLKGMATSGGVGQLSLSHLSAPVMNELASSYRHFKSACQAERAKDGLRIMWIVGFVLKVRSN